MWNHNLHNQLCIFQPFLNTASPNIFHLFGGVHGTCIVPFFKFNNLPLPMLPTRFVECDVMTSF